MIRMAFHKDHPSDGPRRPNLLAPQPYTITEPVNKADITHACTQSIVNRIEKRLEAVEIPAGNRIVLVIVALSAPEAYSQKDRRSGGRDFVEIYLALLLGYEVFHVPRRHPQISKRNVVADVRFVAAARLALLVAAANLQ
jgi:hypothetical protein